MNVNVTADKVKEAILKTPRIKIKEDQVRVSGKWELVVYPIGV